MLRLALRRVLIIPFVLFLANFFGFAYAYHFGPLRALSNPYSSGRITQPAVIPEYIAYLQRVAVFDWGVLQTGQPVTTAIWRALSASAGLLIFALFLSAVIGLFLGFRAVHSDPPRVSFWMTLVSTVGMASPAFYIGILFVAFSVFYVIWGPTSQPLFPFQGYGWDAHMVLPTLTLMALPTVKIAQVTSGMLVGEIGKQYVVAARSLGHTMPSIRRKYAFRNIVVPVLLTVSGSLRFLVAELILIERLFSWPGLGRLISLTLVGSDQSGYFLYPPLMAALMTVLAAIFLITDLIATLLARAFDPRVGTS